MENTLKLVGKNSSEIFMLRYPSSIIDFCEFDFSFFAEGAINVCNEALKSGTPDLDRISELRRDIRSAHGFIEHNILTEYEKIVYDCWIDYVCRRDNISASGLWNRYIRCKTPFEKAIFARLSEFRYNRAVNEWLNIIRLQDYANSKVNFVFIDGLKSAEEAAARRNYFDLMFSVTARELGCRIEDLGVTKVFTVGRVPTAPFIFPNISKEIVRHVLAGFDYSDDYSDIGDYSEVSDQVAMDAFSRMKAGLPQEFSSYNIVRGKMEKYSDKIYMPCSLKAAIDLEIDAIIEDKAWLSRCKRCGRYFLRDAEHLEEYCSRFIPNGKTCLEIYNEEHPSPRMTPELAEKCRAVTDEVYSRVDKIMSMKEYEYWYSYLQAMVEKVGNGEIAPSELENFLNYSLEVDITKSHPIEDVPRREREYPKERVVKPFIPERISRAELSEPKPEEPREEPRRRDPKDGFFTSPTVQQRKSERPQVTHIIRNGESLGARPEGSGFTPFVGAQTPAPAPAAPERTVPERQPAASANSRQEAGWEPHTPPDFSFVSENLGNIDNSDNSERIVNNEHVEQTEQFEHFEQVEHVEQAGQVEQPGQFEPFEPEKPEKPAEPAKPRVIRKNAAAISAYGKIAGAPIAAAPPDMEIISSPRAETAEETPPEPPKPPKPSQSAKPVDTDPFKDVGSIFDVLQQSEENLGAGRVKPRVVDEEPAPEWEDKPKKPLTRENAPSGIWTEDRRLFPNSPTEQAAPGQAEEHRSELEMLKDKKRSRTNKTQRLFDVIMREPDDNPNFRK